MAAPKEIKTKVYRATSAIDRGYEIVEILLVNPDGVSFNQIRKETGLNPNSLTQKLWRLMEEGIIERNIVTPDENRRYSFYKLTKEGRLLIEKLEELNASKILK